MNRKGLRTNKGKPISRGYFYRMMRNEVYAGWIKKFGERHKGFFDPIISQELFDKVQRVINHKKKRGFDYRKDNPDFPLRRFVFHPSGKKLTGSWSKGRAKKYPYYRFPGIGCEVRKSYLEEGFKTFLGCFDFNEMHFEAFKIKVRENLIKKIDERKNLSNRIAAHIEDLKLRQTGMIQKNYQGIISDDVLREQSIVIEKEIADSQIALHEIPNINEDVEGALDYAGKYLLSPHEVWEKSPYFIKWELQWFQFPQGIYFDGKEIGTNEVCSLYKVNSNFLHIESPKVPLRLRISNTPKVTNYKVGIRKSIITSEPKTVFDEIFWQKVRKDIITLGTIMRQFERGCVEGSIAASDNFSVP